MKRSALLLSATLLALGSACTKKPAAVPKTFDADANSGPDAKRSGAQPIEVNKQFTDNVDFDKADRTDWKSVELKGKPGPLTVELHWDNAASDVTVDVFDDFGQQIASSPPASGEPLKKLTVNIETLATYFIRIQAAKRHSASDYTLMTKWSEEAAPPPVVEKEETPAHKKVHHPGTVKKKGGGGSPESGVQGRIVSSYREGGAQVLHLDKGSAAGVQVGQNGWILEGPSGASPLDGGGFTVTQVIDDGRSIAKTNVKSLSKNTRVSINTGK